MASCVGCKKRTASFCYVHKQSVCDDCTHAVAVAGAGGAPAPASVQCQSHDFLGNYFDWLADSDYSWPPRCTLCNRALQDDPQANVRLVCKHLFHRTCLRRHLQEAGHAEPGRGQDCKCPNCAGLLVDTATQARTKLRESVTEFVRQLPLSIAPSPSKSESPFVIVSQPSVPAPELSASPTPSIPSSSSSSISSSYLPSGAVSRSAITINADLPVESPIRSYVTPSFASPISSSSSHAHSSHSHSHDLESQHTDVTGKRKKLTFERLRHASRGGLTRLRLWLRPQRIILLVMLFAFLLMAGFYVRFSLQLIAPNAGNGGIADNKPPTTLVDAVHPLTDVILNAD